LEKADGDHSTGFFHWRIKLPWCSDIQSKSLRADKALAQTVALRVSSGDVEAAFLYRYMAIRRRGAGDPLSSEIA
jgi:hypothetical protein